MTVTLSFETPCPGCGEPVGLIVGDDIRSGVIVPRKDGRKCVLFPHAYACVKDLPVASMPVRLRPDVEDDRG